MAISNLDALQKLIRGIWEAAEFYSASSADNVWFEAGAEVHEIVRRALADERVTIDKSLAPPELVICVEGGGEVKEVTVILE